MHIAAIINTLFVSISVISTTTIRNHIAKQYNGISVLTESTDNESTNAAYKMDRVLENTLSKQPETANILNSVEIEESSKSIGFTREITISQLALEVTTETTTELAVTAMLDISDSKVITLVPVGEPLEQWSKSQNHSKISDAALQVNVNSNITDFPRTAITHTIETTAMEESTTVEDYYTLGCLKIITMLLRKHGRYNYWSICRYLDDRGICEIVGTECELALQMESAMGYDSREVSSLLIDTLKRCPPGFGLLGGQCRRRV